MESKVKIAVIGAGASGCLCAIELKRRIPSCMVNLYESGKHPLEKVALTGGGRCNLTNDFSTVRNLKDIYPRGHRLMERLLKEFGPEDIMEWFRQEGVRIKVEEQGRIFPLSDDAMQIVRTLENLLKRTGVNLFTSRRIGNISELDENIKVVATGGNSLSILDGSGIGTAPCVPSLFAFKLGNEPLCSIPGIRIDKAVLHIPGTSFKSEGPLLTAHWGISGPSVLKMSSYAARYLADNDYKSNLCINWLSGASPSQAESILSHICSYNKEKMLRTTPAEGIPSAIWKYIMDKCALREDIRWGEIGSKGLARLRETLTSDLVKIEGRAPHKEEFVTCGGIDLAEVNPSTLEAKQIDGLFFAGEALDIDAITGGFNLQAAWTTGYVAAKNISNKIKDTL